MSNQLNARSRARLEGVHPKLVAVVERAAQISPVAFVVTEGLRTAKRQAELVAAGASRTMRSRHLTGHAVDVAAFVPTVDTDGDGRDDDGIEGIRWDWPLYGKIAAAMKQAAAEMKVPLEWGGDWKTFRDGPHFQLPRKDFP